MSTRSIKQHILILTLNILLPHSKRRDRTERLFDQCDKFFVIKAASSDHAKIFANVAFSHEIEHLLTIDTTYRGPCTNHRHAEGMV